MAGTDRSRFAAPGAGPVFILVEPQLPQNIGAAARAMANFGLERLRLVKPREGFPHPEATAMAAGAAYVLERAEVFDDVAAAISDLTLVHATTARQRNQDKIVEGPDDAAAAMAARLEEGESCGVLFGRERTGLTNEEVGLADRILTFPVAPGYASLNLSQAVLLVGYEWHKRSSGGALPFAQVAHSPPATKGELLAFFAHLEGELEDVGFFHPEHRRPVMRLNLRNIFQRLSLSRQDLSTLHGVLDMLVEGRRDRERRRERRILPPVTPLEGEDD